MIKIFRKEKMIERLTREGLADEITPEIEAIMDNLDGQEANTYCWQNVVNDEPIAVVVGKDGKTEYVNVNDCD